MRTTLAKALRLLADRLDPPTPHTYTLYFEPSTITTTVATNSANHLNHWRYGGM